jgi:hypothetical protein
MNLPESPQLPRGPLVLSFRDQIAARHHEGKQIDQILRDALLKKLNLVRDTGSLIEQAKETLHESEFRTATDFLDREAIRSYIRFSKQHEEPVTDVATGIRSLGVAMQTTGFLPFPDGHGEQQLHSPNFFSACCFLIQRLAREFSKFVRVKPLKSWRTETLESFSADLVPLGRMIATVSAELKRRETPQR